MDYCDILFTNNGENRHRRTGVVTSERENSINIALKSGGVTEDAVQQQTTFPSDASFFFSSSKKIPLLEDCKKKFLVAYYYQYKMGHGMGRVFVDEYENTMFSVAGIKAVEKKISDNLGESAICVVQNIIELKGDSCNGNE